MLRKATLPFLLLPLILAACGDEETTPAETATEEYAAQAVMACDMIGRAPTALDASATVDGVPAADDHAHLVHVGMVYDITLPPGGTGYVAFHCSEAHSDWIAFTDVPAAVDNVYDEGALFDTPSSKNNSHCVDAIPGQTRLHMHEAKPYVLELSGAEHIRLLILQGDTGHPDTTEDADHTDHTGHGG